MVVATSFRKERIMNQNLRTLRGWTACGLVAFGIGKVGAQMPVPLLDSPDLPPIRGAT